MSSLTSSDLLLIFGDLLGTQRPSIEDTLSFKLFGAALDNMHAEVRGVVAALTKKPLALELEETDFVHDSTGGAIFYIVKGLMRLPDLGDEHKALLKQVRDKFVSTLKSLTETYEDEAAAAKKKTEALAELKEKLEAFPVAPGITLYSILNAHVQAGLKIDALLASRAKTTAETDSKRVKEARALRPKAIGLLGKFRDALAHEVEENKALPRNLEAVAFSYFDQLEASREGRRPAPPVLDSPPTTQG